MCENIDALDSDIILLRKFNLGNDVCFEKFSQLLLYSIPLVSDAN